MAPVKEAVQQLAQSPVFVDESGRRRAWVMWTLIVGGALCLGYVLLLGFSLVGGPIKPGDLLPLPGLRQSGERSPVPTPSHPTTVGPSPTAPPESGVGVPSGVPSVGVPTGAVRTAPTTTPTGSGAGGGPAPAPTGSPQSSSSPAPSPSSPAPSPSSPAPSTSSPGTTAEPGVAPSASLGVAVPSASPAGSVGQ